MAEFEGFDIPRASAPAQRDRAASVSHAGPSRSSSMNPRIERALAVQEYVARHPVVESAVITKHTGDHVVVKARLSTTSFATQRKKYYTQTYFVSTRDGEAKVSESPMEPVSEEVKMSTLSKDGKWSVNFRATTVNDKKKRIIEIVHAETGVYDEVDVTDKHAEFLSGDHWGNPTWLEDERLLVYVAEQHPPSWKDDDKPFNAYTYTPNFGEQLSGQTRPGLFLLDFSKDEDTHVIAIEPLKDVEIQATVSYRQPALAPRKSEADAIQLYATGSSLLPDGRRLGSIYCSNRPDAIYQFTIHLDRESDMVSQATMISSSKRSARYPRIATQDDKSSLVYISNRRGYEHGSCASLHKRALPINKTGQDENDTLVNVVRTPSPVDSFPGLYPSAIPAVCGQGSSDASTSTSSKTPFILVESAWASRTTIVAVNLEDGSVHDQGSDDISSFKLLSTNSAGGILAVRSSTITPPELLLGTLTTSPEPHTKWTILKKAKYEFTHKHFVNTTDLYSTIVPLPNRIAAEAIVVTGFPLDSIKVPGQLHTSPIPGIKSSVGTVSSGPQPVIIVPHGGPCSQYSSGWNLSNCLGWVAAGYTVAIVNYPGSTGFGQDTIEELSKDCGNLEVRCCVELKKYLIELGIATDDKGKRLYLGGSHSGFMGAHLSVRYSEEFDALDLRNPVIDLPSMFATSDIPEWTLNQLGFVYDFEHPPAFVPQEVHDELRKRSPSYYAQKLFEENKAPCVPPTQLQVGANDLRVPSNQGKAWYHCLKGHGEEVNMLFFPDNGHPLEQIWTQRKSFHGQLEFLVKHSRF